MKKYKFGVSVVQSAEWFMVFGLVARIVVIHEFILRLDSSR